MLAGGCWLYAHRLHRRVVSLRDVNAGRGKYAYHGDHCGEYENWTTIHRRLPYFIWKRGAHRSRSAGFLLTLGRAICHVAARVGRIVIPFTAPSFEELTTSVDGGLQVLN